MPYTFNGCGTLFYGERDRAEDGSYIATEWITFFYLPLLPIRSYRVLPVGIGTNLLPVHKSQSYQAVRVPLCWPQVRNVYLGFLAIILFFCWPYIQNWWKADVMKSGTSQSVDPSR